MPDELKGKGMFRSAGILLSRDSLHVNRQAAGATKAGCGEGEKNKALGAVAQDLASIGHGGEFM
jgi:hypothetical protein